MLLTRGDIGGARIVLGRALDLGSAEAAFRLAESYDPLMLSARRTLGTRGDPARARELYARAYEAGIQEAKARMDALR
jgi:TPR repeat protein